VGKFSRNSLQSIRFSLKKKKKKGRGGKGSGKREKKREVNLPPTLSKNVLDADFKRGRGKQPGEREKEGEGVPV